MTDDIESEPPPKINNVWQLIAWYAQANGALIFGVVAILSMWLIMVVPELNRNTVSNEIQRAVIEDLRQHAQDQKEISAHLKTTAQILERLTEQFRPDP